MADEPSSSQGLPQWPKEAKELPAGKPLQEQFRWLYILGGIGLAGGVIRGAALGGGVAFALGYGVGACLLLMLVGYVVDRTRWQRERLSRSRDS